MVIMAPSDEVELVHMVATQAAYDAGPSAVRYPRGEGSGLALPARGTPMPIGRGRVVREPPRGGPRAEVAILALGPRLADALVAADELSARGLPTTVADARFAKPLDTAMIERLARDHAVLVTIEDGSVGGFGSAVLQHLAWAGLLDPDAETGGVKIRPMVLPDRFVDHNTPAAQMVEVGLTAKDIVRTVVDAVSRRGEVRLVANR